LLCAGKSGLVVSAEEDGAGDAMEGEEEDGAVETEETAEEGEAAVTETEKVNIYIKLKFVTTFVLVVFFCIIK